MLNTLIHENQKGFLAGRYIGENTRLLYDLIHYCNEKCKPGLILLIDFEKGFDSVSWNFIFKALRFFNFGDNFIKWIKILFCNARLCVIQHGFFSEFFPMKRGCRQGDPISPYLFLLCAEIMGIMIRNNTLIKGIVVNDKEFKLMQYADDTVLALDGTQYSLKSALSLVDQFAKFSGLRPNFDKTLCIKIGELKNNVQVENFCLDYNIKWSQEPFTVLGITYCVDLDNDTMMELNYSNKLQEIKHMISSWSRRLLTTAGRITVVKTLIIPKITHLLISLPNPPSKTILEIERNLFQYIWNSKTHKVSKNCIIQS